MPNGGSDCCGTCWFNARNKGEVGYGHIDSTEPHFCTIRNLPIESGFYTYCANHPNHRPERETVPIGPVLTGNSLGERQVWKPSPDTEEIRRHLIGLLDRIDERPGFQDPSENRGFEAVIRQLGEFREARAVEPLRRIAAFEPVPPESAPYRRPRYGLVEAAQEALEQIAGSPG
jgi:hypothetical protein